MSQWNSLVFSSSEKFVARSADRSLGHDVYLCLEQSRLSQINVSNFLDTDASVMSTVNLALSTSLTITSEHD